MADGNDTCTCLGHLYQKRAQAARWTNYSFSFLSQKTKILLVPYLVLIALVASEQIATYFSVKVNAWSQSPPLNHGFGVTLAYTSFPVPMDTIFVVLMI